MKRRREMAMEKAESEIKLALDELSLMVKLKSSPPTTTTTTPVTPPPAPGAEASTATHTDHLLQVPYNYVVPTRPFLSFCSLILQVLDKIGPTMAVLRQDVYQNIQRLELRYESDPATYYNLVEMLKKEACEQCARKNDSCSKALVWLTRSVDLTAAMLQKLATDPQISLEEAVEASYNAALKPWHGWISSAAYKVALKLLPDKQTFIKLLMSPGQDLDAFKGELQSLISLLVPMLEDMHSILTAYGLERVKCT